MANGEVFVLYTLYTYESSPIAPFTGTSLQPGAEAILHEPGPTTGHSVVVQVPGIITVPC